MYCPRASKLATRFAVTPLSSCIAAVVCVGVVAAKRSPVRGPISIVRSSVRVEAKPATRSIGAEQGHDRGQVVRAHVEQRAGAVGVEDVGIRVPGLLAADEHRGADRQRVADRALVDRRAPGLVGRAEEDVGRAADAQPAALGLGGQRGGLGLVGRERLLGVDVLARRERRDGDRRRARAAA